GEVLLDVRHSDEVGDGEIDREERAEDRENRCRDRGSLARWSRGHLVVARERCHRRLTVRGWSRWRRSIRGLALRGLALWGLAGLLGVIHLMLLGIGVVGRRHDTGMHRTSRALRHIRRSR